MIKYVNEMLADIEKASGDAKIEQLKKWGEKAPLNLVLSLNFDDRLVVDLPEGMPPYKRDESVHPDTFQTDLAREIGRMKIFFKGQYPDMKKHQKQNLFIQILEGIPPGEADVLVHVKDKSLTEMYPSITYDLVKSVFPNYCWRTNNDKVGDSKQTKRKNPGNVKK
jgi:hypothetical protein